MNIVFDIECERLIKPEQIWVIVCKNIDTGEVFVFRNLTSDEREKDKFISFARGVTKWIGHNVLHYDVVHVNRLLLGTNSIATESVLDTLVVSKLLDYSRSEGHSVEDYGLEFGLAKLNDKKDPIDFSKYSKRLEEYCIRDVEITHKIYLKYLKYITSPTWSKSLDIEHKLASITYEMSNNGFSFNKGKAEVLLKGIEEELAVLDRDILKEFPPRARLMREVHPVVTKHGTLHKKDFRFVLDGDLSEYNGGPFSRLTWQEFNPASHKQIIEILNKAGWQPVDKTQTHIDTERTVNTLKFKKNRTTALDSQLQEAHSKMVHLEKNGWKINENNLATLPSSAPSPAKTLAKRILLESRRRTLVEWLSLVSSDDRIHGTFHPIGAWTHRMAHQKPNTANIPTEQKLFGSEMRALWQADRKRLLVGVDAEGIQFRVAAHYIADPELIRALVNGNKKNGTDPHSITKRVLGEICKHRNAGKQTNFSLFLGGKGKKISQILNCGLEEAEEGIKRVYKQWPGMKVVREEIAPRDARRGWFLGLDGRAVKIPGETFSERKHLAPSGYLQNGEATIMKHATDRWHSILLKEKVPFWFVNFVHDEWQTETVDDMEVAMYIAKVQAESLAWAGNELGCTCPMAGSFWNEDHQRYTIGKDWSVTH